MVKVFKAVLLAAVFVATGCATSTAPKGVVFAAGEMEACAAQPANLPCTVWTNTQLHRFRILSIQEGRVLERAIEEGRRQERRESSGNWNPEKLLEDPM